MDHIQLIKLSIKPRVWKFVLPLFWFIFVFMMGFTEAYSVNEILLMMLSYPVFYAGMLVSYVASSLINYIILIIKQRRILAVPIVLILLAVVTTYFIILKQRDLNKPVIPAVPVQNENRAKVYHYPRS